MKPIDCGMFNIQTTARPDVDQMVYLISSTELKVDEAVKWSNKYNCNVSILYGVDGEDALTPWPAAHAKKGSPEYGGKGHELLAHLVKEVFPTVEKVIGHKHYPIRTIAGESLSALFALWSWSDTAYFRNACCVSGSFWYPRFMDWICGKQIQSKEGRVHILQLEKDIETAYHQLTSNGEATKTIFDKLKDSKIDVTYNIIEGETDGRHEPLFDLALESIFS